MQPPRLLMIIFMLSFSGCYNGSESSISTADKPPQSSNKGCLASKFSASSAVKLSRQYENLSFSSPILMLQAKHQSQYWYIAEKGGAIYRIDTLSEQRSLVANLSTNINLSNCNECGLLGMAFHPDFENNGYLYLSYTENRSSNMFSVISRFTSSNNGVNLDLNSRHNIFEVQQPYGNHNGGHIAFGPDGYLYFGSGDGGSANDPQGHAQNTNTPLGAMLRMQDDGSAAPGNIVEGDARIYAYGLRNPWRWSFDRENGQLWAGDVGQNRYEEVNIITRGGNYGWRCYEGLHQTQNSCSNNGPYTAPVTEYGRSEGYSITGGYVYRGTTMKHLNGVYIFADFGSGRVWGLFKNDKQYERRLLLNSSLNVASFSEDNNGEVYIIDYSGGLYKIESDIRALNNDLPNPLSETDCVN